MPGGWRLLIKEHPVFTAPRPVGFWKRVRAYPNVVVLSTFERGEETLHGAKALATVRGTLGLQAAAVGLPVITPHPAYHGAGLPHVFVTESYRAVEAALCQIACDELPPIAERVQAFHAWRAIFDSVSVPIADPNLIQGVAGGQSIEPAELARIADLLADGLGLRLDRATPASLMKGAG
ncbi:MAG: hypothetical protein EXQ99_03525 [Alphaproteobacteria bacterium]|nr:hypothetical protein [Alphaproteobacteria bacterium]